MIRDIDESNLAAAREFLEVRVETSLLLLGNLESFGPRVGTHPYSGNFRAIEQAGAIAAVFCLTRGGNLLMQTGGRTDLAPEILEACAREPQRVEGVIGEWHGANSVWRLLCGNPDFRATHGTRDVLYRLQLTRSPPATDDRIRFLRADDFEQWDTHIGAFLAGEGIPHSGTADERRAVFQAQTAQRCWWGAFDGPHLTSTAALNARYRDTGQIGGVYTKPEYRKRGISRAVMHALMRDAREIHNLNRLMLFTGERSTAARRLYESLNFELCGSFALFFGSWLTAPRQPALQSTSATDT